MVNLQEKEMQKPLNLRDSYLLSTLAVVLWGLSFVWTNDILNQNIPPFTFLFVRLTCAGALLYVYARLSGRLQKVTEGNGHPLQYSGLENSIDKGAWQATVHGVTISQI